MSDCRTNRLATTSGRPSTWASTTTPPPRGCALFQRRAAKLEPDYVTVYFGWNDHWRTFRPDHMRMKVKMPRWKGTLIQKLRKKKFFQYLSNLRTPRQKLTQDEDDYYLRVPQEYYRQNLVSFVREIRALKAIPILITAPRAEVLTKSLVTNRQVATLEDAYRLHDEYVEITRAVARSGLDSWRSRISGTLFPRRNPLQQRRP